MRLRTVRRPLSVPRRSAGAWLLAFGLLGAATAPVRAQGAHPRVAHVRTFEVDTRSAGPLRPVAWPVPEGDAASPPRASLYSLVVPGAGQLTMGQRRGWAYLAAEGVAWYLHLDRRAEGTDLRHAYRRLAWETARGMRGPEVVDDFEYYERLLRWTSSGAFDRDPAAAGLQPETDPATFNGSVWERAAAIFLGPGADSAGPGDPGYGDALAYYRERAYTSDLLWDWSGSATARERFGGLVDESDEQLREATMMIGLILANHVLSAVDAFVSARLREATDGRVDGSVAFFVRGMRPAPASGPPGLPVRPAGSVALRLAVFP